MTRTEYQIVPATEEHAREMALVMRQADVDEVWAASHYEPLEALLVSLRLSPDPRAGLADGRVVCIYGVGQATLLSAHGVPWMLTAEELPDHARAFLRRNKLYLSEIRSKYRLLLNFVDARNTMAIRWLEWLGFDIAPAQPLGAENLPFHPFKMET